MTLWLAVLGCSTPSEPPPALLIAVDQLRADELGSYGNLPTDTPRIDRLGARGTQFTRAYAPSASVGPSRASLKTGMLPPQHGHREEGPESVEYGEWVRRVGWNPCEVTIDVSEFKKVNSVLDNCVSDRSRITVVWVVRGEQSSLAQLDAVVGHVVETWDATHPDSMGAMVGLTGRADRLRVSSSVLLVDDILRVPLMVWGPGQAVKWEVDEVVSIAALGRTMARSAGVPLADTVGTSGRVYHESTVGYSQFGTRPLTAFTRAEGRYVEGVYGRWYPAKGEVVRQFEDPQSGYPEASRELSELIDALGPGTGLPETAWVQSVDPAERAQAVTLVSKLRSALGRGRLGAAQRILARLEGEFAGAPILPSLRTEVETQSERSESSRSDAVPAAGIRSPAAP